MKIAPPTPSRSRPLASYDRDAIEGLADVHDLSFATDSSGRIFWMSDALGELCGGRHNFVGNDWTEMLAPQPNTGPSARVHRELLTRSGSGGLLVELEPTPGAKAAYHLSPLEIDSDSSTRSLAVVLRAEGCSEERHEALRSDVLKAVLEALPNAVLALDDSGHVFFANAAAGVLLGRTPQELHERAIAQLLPLGTRLGEVAKCLRLGALAPNCELSMPQPQGRPRRVTLQARPLVIPGAPACRVLTLTTAPDGLADTDRLEQKIAELESYVQSVSHDLRSPLVSLLGFTRLLRQDYESLLDETGRHFLNRIEQAGQTMDALIQDLLEISRIGGPGETRDLVDPRSVILQLVAELKPRLEEEGVKVEIPQSPPLILCNRTRLYQVFSNLIGNALAHMGPAKNARIRVTIEERAKDHLITVADNGTGIAPEAHQRIFEMFQTLGGRGAGGSSGMGLAIVKKIAETHGGRVWVESEPGQGASFFVTVAR